MKQNILVCVCVPTGSSSVRTGMMIFMVSNRDETFVPLFLLQHSHTHTHPNLDHVVNVNVLFHPGSRNAARDLCSRSAVGLLHFFAWPDNHSMILSYFFHVRAFLGADEELLPAAAADFSDAAPASILRCTGFKNVSLMVTS